VVTAPSAALRKRVPFSFLFLFPNTSSVNDRKIGTMGSDVSDQLQGVGRLGERSSKQIR
jgi:hypothetical protein